MHRIAGQSVRSCHKRHIYKTKNTEANPACSSHHWNICCCMVEHGNAHANQKLQTLALLSMVVSLPQRSEIDAWSILPGETWAVSHNMKTMLLVLCGAWLNYYGWCRIWTEQKLHLLELMRSVHSDLPILEKSSDQCIDLVSG